MVAVGLLAFSGCGSETKTNTATRTASTPPAAAKPKVSPLVGTWRRINSCEIVRADVRAGRAPEARAQWLVGGGYFERAAEIDDAHPCRGATEAAHSHFFTKAGGFGSYDEFPTHAREFGGEITVRYRIEGDMLTFAVVVPDRCTGKCRLATAWAISAFYPGPFRRVK